MRKSSGGNSGHLRHVRWLTVALTVTAIGLAACGGDDGDEGTTNAAPDTEATSPPAAEGGEPILIKTDVSIDIPEGGPVEGSPQGGGEVLHGSSLGESPFCPRGTFRDQHGNAEIGLVDRSFRCPDGNLRIGFTPGVPEGRTQAGPWKVVSGTGAFEGLVGDGQMEIKYEPGTRGSEGRETFTGTVVR